MTDEIIAFSENSLDRRSPLFAAHATHGIPLSVALMILKEKGCVGNLAEFFFDSMVGGWSPEQALEVIEGASRDNEMAFDKARFMASAASVWTECQTASDNVTWENCSKRCRDGMLVYAQAA